MGRKACKMGVFEVAVPSKKKRAAAEIRRGPQNKA
jgi:hypothetical protein